MCSMKITFQYLALNSICLLVLSTPVLTKCTEQCNQGEFCKDDECLPCPFGQFQKKPSHQDLTCEPWTTKPKNENWVIVKNGSNTEDVVWGCEEGYYKYEYRHDEYSCILNQTSSTEVTTNATTTLDSLTDNTTIAKFPSVHSGENKKLVIGLSVGLCGGVAVVAIIVIFIYYCRRRHKQRESRSTGPEGKPLVQEHQIKDFIYKLGTPECQIFFGTLKDPSGKFNFHQELEEQKKLSTETEKQYAGVLKRWLESNNKQVHKKYIKKALIAARRPDLYCVMYPDDASNNVQPTDQVEGQASNPSSAIAMADINNAVQNDSP
ncbi:uncharacterized protein LOC131928219 [Physella acuta]|uniref:uncharacterized protein LOC131928219 n=1 Tax=Physella acuta TaxID=109671 RepID=UPI0027DC7E73|nr:uncharacterized protein LOC131928219 [Physella acuta]